jgi:nitroreductase
MPPIFLNVGRIMANQVFEAVRTVLAIREYQDKDVPEEVIRRVAESGHLSASAGNRQPWHFVVVRDRETLKRLGSLMRTGPYVAGSAFAIVVAYERDTVLAVSDASRAAQSMILTAWGDGVGSNWTGFGGLLEVAKELGIPDSYDVLAVLPFGYPARQVGKGRKNRRPLGEVVSAERFGQPFS